MAEDVTDGEKYLSDWDDEKFPVNFVPAPIPSKILPPTREQQKKIQVQPNRTRLARNQSIIENQKYTKSLITKSESSATSTNKFLLPKEMRRPPKKYRKCLLPTKLADNGISSYNRTSFTGLDNTFSDSYINPIIQILFYCPQFREKLLHHLCSKEFCISCEIGFLFHSMEKMDGKITPNSNLLKTLRHIPDNGRRNFLQYQTKNSPFSTLLSDSLDFILDQIRRELLNYKLYSLLPNNHHDTDILQKNIHQLPGISNDSNSNSNNNNAIDETFISSFRKLIKCTFCNCVSSFVQPRGTYKFQYLPFGPNNTSGNNNNNSASFTDLLYQSMIQELNEECQCPKCNRRNIMRTTSRPIEIAPVLIIHTNIQSSNQLKSFIPTKETGNFVPEEISFTISEDKFKISSSLSNHNDDDKNVNDVSSCNEENDDKNKYRLVGVLCQILDNKMPSYASPHHFVAHVNIPNVYARSFYNDDLVSPSSDTNDKFPHDGNGWFLFNDFSISPENIDDVLKFAEWKIPVVLIYQQISNLNQYKNSNPAANIKIPEEIFFTNNPLEKSRIRPIENIHPNISLINSIEELPKKGDLLPIDTEFVSLAPPQRFKRSDGRVTEIRPSKSCLARVSALVCNKNHPMDWKILSDDYIVNREPIADYLTRFSGITPGDLNPCTSKHSVVTLKSMYLKLRILVERGCIFVGHGLHKDFWICNLYVPPSQFRDTVDLFKLPYQRMISLRYLAHHLLEIDIQGITHDSVEDAETALKLYLKYEELKNNGSFSETLKQLYDKGRASKWKLPSDSAVDTGDVFQFV